MEAHNHSTNLIVRRFARLAVIALLCALPGALASAAEANAVQPVAGALGAVAQTQQRTTQELSSTASATVAQTSGPAGTPTSAPATPAPVPSTPQHEAPASPNSSHAALEGGRAAVTSTVRDTSERIGAASDTPQREGQAPILTTMHYAAAGSPYTPVVGGAVQRATQSPADSVVRAATYAVVHTARASHVVQTLANDASTLTRTTAHLARAGGTIERLTSSLAGPGIAALQSIGLRPIGLLPGLPAPGATQATARRAPLPSSSSLPMSAPSQTSASRQSGTPQSATSLQSSMVSSAHAVSSARQLLLAPTSLLAETELVGYWSAPARPRSDSPAPIAGAGEVRAQLLISGQSAGSPPAHDAPAALLPASPAPAPSPGGVSPAAAVGSGAGVSTVLTLVALLLAAPLAARRLRLDSELWQVAPFVLIVDRPG